MPRSSATWRLAVLAAAFAAAIAANAAAANELRPAPLYGADVRSLVFDPRSPERALAGTSSGQIYRSDDGGETWRDAGAAAPFAGWVVGALHFDVNRPERLWAALWGVWGGGAVAGSDDLGATWTLRAEGLPADDQVYAVATVAGAPGRLLVGTRTGVWRSDDDGRSWRSVSAATPGLSHVSSLLVDPQDARRVLAGTWRRAYRSDDGGETWRGAFDGMVLDSEVFALAPVPGRAGELWAATCGWVYRGSGFGSGWTRVTEGFAERRTPSLLVTSAERILAGTVGGLHVSRDGGRSFRRTSERGLPVLALAAHPERPERVLVGTEGAGIWLSRDGGDTLSPQLAATTNLRVPVLAASADVLFAAVTHAGPLSGVYHSPDRGGSFLASAAALPTVLDLAFAGDRLFAATERGLWERAGGEWRRIAELGEGRVEQLVTAGARVVARTGDGLFERVGERFEPVRFDGGEVRAAGLAWGELWVRTEAALWRLSATAPAERSELPAADGRLLPGGSDELLVASGSGLFRRRSPAGAWEPLGAEGARLLPTGDPRFPYLRADAHALELEDAAGSRTPLATAFPASAAVSARLAAERLWVGTSGYGLWSVTLPRGLATAAAGAGQTGASDARMRR